MKIDRAVYSAEVRRLEGGTSRIRREVAAGELTRIRRGAYSASEEWLASDPRARHARMALAYARSARSAPVFRRETAAVLLGIPVIGALPDRPVVGVPPRNARSDPGAIRCAGVLADEEVIARDGLLMTSPLRTAIDVGSARGVDAAVVALSHVAREWSVPIEVMEEWLLAHRPFRGARRIEGALPAVSPLSEAPIESLGMLRTWQGGGFVLPRQQVEIVVNGRLYRLDWEWDEGPVFGEADGRVKYIDPDALWKEKLREDALRSVCRSFFRVTWSDTLDRTIFDAKLHRAGVPRR